jgi:hypothetical protein
MRREVPRAAAAHGKTAHHNPLRIDREVPFHGVHRFEHIDLTGKFRRVAVSAVRMQHDRGGWHDLAGFFLVLVDECEFGPLFATAGEDHIESARDSSMCFHVRRNHQRVGLEGVVQF